MNTKKRTVISLLVLLAAAVMAVCFLVFPGGPLEEEIRDTTGKAGRSDLRLVILSDVHYDPSKYASGERDILAPTMDAIARLAGEMEKRECRIDAFWNLGDFINGHGTTKAEAGEQIAAVVRAENRVSPDFHNIMGNHDSNIHATRSDPPQPETEVLTVAEINDLLANPSSAQTEVHHPAHPTDYYVDLGEIRVVCLSAEETTFLPETAEWLRDTALKTGSDVLVLSHIPTRPEWGFRNDVVNGDLIEAALREFIDAGGTVIACIHGHDHGDMVNRVTAEDGRDLYPEIAVGCARFQFPTSNGTPGMAFRERNPDDATLLLFDVAAIDRESRTIRLTRFGAGEDRTVAYGTGISGK